MLVGFFEEGVFRCYLQATLTRGINFWWALGVVSDLRQAGDAAQRQRSVG